jgi:hypothetical protein
MRHRGIFVQALLFIAYDLIAGISYTSHNLASNPALAVLTETAIKFVGIIEHIEILVALLRFFLHIGE